MAISGDAQPGHSVLAEFVSGLGEQVKAVFAQVLMVCDAQDKAGQDLPADRQRRIDEMSAEARRMREFVATRPKKLNARGQEIKGNVSDEDSAKMATSKGVIQGYAAQAAVYSQRMGTVEPVFGNIRHNKRLNRFTLRGKAKVCGQWHLYCLVHNIEKLAKAGIGQAEKPGK